MFSFMEKSFAAAGFGFGPFPRELIISDAVGHGADSDPIGVYICEIAIVVFFEVFGPPGVLEKSCRLSVCPEKKVGDVNGLA